MRELEEIKTSVSQTGQAEHTWSPGFNTLYDLCERVITIARTQWDLAEHWSQAAHRRAKDQDNLVEQRDQARAAVLKGRDALTVQMPPWDGVRAEADWLTGTESYEQFRHKEE